MTSKNFRFVGAKQSKCHPVVQLPHYLALCIYKRQKNWTLQQKKSQPVPNRGTLKSRVLQTHQETHHVKRRATQTLRSARSPSFCFIYYFATIFTIRPGTQISFLIVPVILSPRTAFACSMTSSFAASAAIFIVHFVLPFT